MRDDGVLSKTLQHPRRSLGNRYRSQAEKFLRIKDDSGNNISWAEQSAKQSVLYDFTNEENWKILIKIKVLRGDSEGARAVLADLFSVLGRDPELMKQLANQDIIGTCEGLLTAAFSTDPLDPDMWWKKIGEEPEEIEAFSERLKGLNVSDQRANILFSRRLERVRSGGFEDIFLELTRVLLSQRPNNHEAWEGLGVVYERREQYDEAWLCYDQAESVFPDSTARERFKQRMESMVGGSDEVAWRVPPISDRAAFLDRLGSLSKPKQKIELEIIDEMQELGTFSKIDRLRREGKITEAFFLARRMAAEGIEGATEKVEELLQEMEE
jgi:tetratricopeptide (TPR) repeat protein